MLPYKTMQFVLNLDHRFEGFGPESLSMHMHADTVPPVARLSPDGAPLLGPE